MSVKIKSYERVPGRFGSYVGKVAVDKDAEPWRVSFPGNRANFSGLATGEIDGKPVSVVGFEKSSIDRTVILRVQP